MRKLTAFPALVLIWLVMCPVDGTAQNSQAQTKIKVQQLVEKKAEYHRLTYGQRNGYRIKVHFKAEHEAAKEVRARFTAGFPDLPTYEEYQQPYWVVLVGDFATKLEAFESLKKIRASFPSAFIVKGKINPR